MNSSYTFLSDYQILLMQLKMGAKNSFNNGLSKRDIFKEISEVKPYLDLSDYQKVVNYVAAL